MLGMTAGRPAPLGEKPIVAPQGKLGNSNQMLPNRTPLSRRRDSLSRSITGASKTQKTNNRTANDSSKSVIDPNAPLATALDKENSTQLTASSTISAVSTPSHARLPAALPVSRNSTSPYTLLSLEMNHGDCGDNEADESLLVSPVAGALIQSVISKDKQQSDPFCALSRVHPSATSAVPNESTNPPTNGRQDAKPPDSSMAPSDQAFIGGARAPFAARVQNSQETSDNRKMDTVPIRSQRTASFDKKRVGEQQHSVMDDLELVSKRESSVEASGAPLALVPTNLPSTRRLLHLRAPSPRVSFAASSPVSTAEASSAAPWSVDSKLPLLSSTLPVSHGVATPFTTRGSGVRMDLSNVFTGAIQGTASEPSSSVDAPRSTKRTAEHPIRLSLSSANGSDEWSEKQVHTFTTWLNYLFYPTGVGDGGSSVSRTGLRSFVSHQRLAQGRLAASTLYKKTDMSNVRQAISSEIARNRIAFRPDRDVNANLTHRDTITGLLLSYSTPWLRLGLETLFGTVIQPEVPLEFSPRGMKHQSSTGLSTRKVPLSHLKLALKQFIVRHVLSDETILAKYTGGRCKVPSGRFGERYRAELRDVVLYRVLVLVIFLDRAKMANVLEQAPNLFEHKATIKSTRELLLFICRDFLKSEGDFAKHLSKIGIQVFYKQEAIDELDFTVTNLRIDLNDGVRLARMAELVTGATLLNVLRLPAVSRLQKIHNVGLALKHLAADGAQIADVAPHHVVDGHREKVLKLLWSVVSQCCLQALLTVKQVEREIGRIRALFCLQPGKNAEMVLEDALVVWSHLVCSRFGSSVTDLSHSFADGKAVCLLIHFYHPNLLRLDEINAFKPSKRRQGHDDMLSSDRSNGILANVCMSDLGIPGMMPSCDTEQPPDEKSMLLCLAFLCSRLIDSSLEIRASITIQLCFRGYRNRAMRLRKNEAAVKILAAWKVNKARYYASQRRCFGAAVSTIETFIASRREALKQARIYRLNREMTQRAAILIQKYARSRFTRQRVGRLIQRQKSSILLQCWTRKVLACRYCQILLRRLHAAMTLQNFWRAFRYLDATKNDSAVLIQRIFRGYFRRLQFVIDKLDVIAVQSCARRWLALQMIVRFDNAATKIQTAVRSMLARRVAQGKVHAVLLNLCACRLQTLFRRRLAEVSLLSMKERTASSVRIQTAWRRQQAVIYFAGLVEARDQTRASIFLQCAWRRLSARVLLKQLLVFAKQSKSCILIQSFWRACLAQETVREIQLKTQRTLAAVLIQAEYRKHQARWLLECMKLYAERKYAAVKLQSFWRSCAIRNKLANMQMAARTIQSTYRRIAPMRFLSRARQSANVVQLRWRTWLSKKRYLATLERICLLQGVARRLVAKLELNRRARAVLTIQCAARQLVAGFRFQEAIQIRDVRIEASTSIQRWWRGSTTRTKFDLVMRDIALIQRTFRRFAAKVAATNRMKAVRSIQSAAQLFLLQKHVDSLILRAFEKRALDSEATVRIQSLFRGWVVRCGFATCVAAATTISRIFRGFLARALCYRTAFEIIQCQSVARRWLVDRVVRRRVVATFCLQRALRSFRARVELRTLRRLRAKASTEYFAATTIQRVFRGSVGRHVALMESSARVIQTTWRSYTVHVQYMISVLAIIDIQAACRRFAAERKYKRQLAALCWMQYFARMSIRKIRTYIRTKSSLLIQTAFRKHYIRCAYLRFQSEETSARTIQSLSRMASSRSRFQKIVQAACQLQRYIRGFLVRMELETESFAAFEIQRMWRGYVAREFVAWHILAAIHVQSFVRVRFARQLARRLRNERLAAHHLCIRSTVKIQREYRSHLVRNKLYKAASLLQNVTRQYLSRRLFRSFRICVVHIQSIHRGNITRKASSKRLATVMASAAKANKAAKTDPRMKLGNRTKAALDILLSSKSLSEIMDAVSILEVATRLSERCCVSFADAGAPAILFSLLRTCNRSLPHVKLLHAVLLTMVNVARFDYLVSSMATISGVEIFLDLLQMFRDKDFVFCLVVSLLELVVRTGAKVVALCASKENLKRLKGVRDLCVRKLSYAGAERLVHRRDSLEVASQLVSARRSAASRETITQVPDVRKGVRRLDRIIRMVEPDRQ